jgi:hypothetical protein
MNPVSPIKWVDLSSTFHLTIQDILYIPSGSSKLIFFLDRNIFDISCDIDTNPINTSIIPSIFFRNNYQILFTKLNNGIKGTWTWRYPDANTKSENKEFDINYLMGKHNSWYPLHNNSVPTHNIYTNKPLNSKFDGLNILELPLNTKIGWRGPMIYMEDIDKLPPIIYKKNGYIL